MIIEITFLSCIGIISIIYNNYILSYIIWIIGEKIYNYIIIFIIILVQIDNISLYNELILNKKNNNDKNDKNDNNDKYMRILINQMSYIIKQNNDIKMSYNINKNRILLFIL